MVLSEEIYYLLSEIISKILFTFIFKLDSVPIIYYFVIFENYVPKFIGSIFSNEPLVANDSLLISFRLHLSPFKLRQLTETPFFLANYAAF